MVLLYQQPNPQQILRYYTHVLRWAKISQVICNLVVEVYLGIHNHVRSSELFMLRHTTICRTMLTNLPEFC